MIRALLWAVLLGAAFPSAAQYEECGELANGYGPFDYRTSRDKLYIVEAVHFTQDVEALRRGASSSLGGDLDYTLRASPNHHRALIAMVNLGRKLNTDAPAGAKYTIPCYFDRAIRFAGNDGVVRLIYGTYLARVGQKVEAVRELELANSIDPNNANIHYNLGLLYFDMKDYPKARQNAQRAYELGFSLPGLKKKLQEAGQWDVNTGTGGSKETGEAAPQTPVK